MGLDIFFVFGIQLLVIIFAVILLVKIPPMNSFYGYRTKMSSINDEYCYFGIVYFSWYSITNIKILF